MAILVGTASWTDKTLIDSGKFYPADVKSPEARLRYYASMFPMVEVDSSYYALPSARNAQAWAERTPDSFVFNIKAFRLLTGHYADLKAFPTDLQRALSGSATRFYAREVPAEILDEIWRRYLAGIDPLRAAGKLCAVHFQFAPWVAASPEWRDYIEQCMGRLAGYRMAVEFRNKSWFEGLQANATLEWERELGITNVVVDEPQGIANTIPSVWDVTTPDLAIVRLHGRNQGTWNIKGATSASDRFNYDYTDDELVSLADDIKSLPSDLIQVVFNNNYEDQGQRNARTLMGILGVLDE